MHHPTDRMVHTTAFVTPVVDHWLEREIVFKKDRGIYYPVCGMVYVKSSMKWRQRLSDAI